MNTTQFETLVTSCIKDKYKEFLFYQNVVLEIFDEFVDVCKKETIKYYLAYGSLLGAVRDGICLPWDYDMDLWVPVSERKRLIESLNRDLGKGYFYVYSDKLSDYPTNCLRVCKKGYPFTAVHVDIFFLIGCPADSKRCEQFKKKVDKECRCREQKYCRRWFPDSRPLSVWRRLVNMYCSLLSTISLQKKIEHCENKLYEKYPLNQTKTWYRAANLAHQPSYLAEWFGEGQEVNLGNRTVVVPSQYDKVLRSIYGDYQKYPSIEASFEEFYKAITVIEHRMEFRYSDEKQNKILIGEE